MDNPKYIEYDGLRFCRDDKTGYYLNSTIRKRLHRYVWEKEVGNIPRGYHVHHIDGDKANNAVSNLAIMTNKGHQRLHGQEVHRKAMSRENMKKATAVAPLWHKSPDGKRWHSEHMQGFTQPREQKTCEICGCVFMGIKRQRFCSNACKAKHRRNGGLDNIQTTCEQCGNVFTHNKYDRQKYCTRACADKAHIGWAKRKRDGA